MKRKLKQPSTLTRDEILSFLRNNKALLKRRYGVTKIGLFGSYARNEQKPTSDIDLLIEMSTPDFDKRFDLGEFLQEKFKKRVDVLYFNSVRRYFTHFIEKDIMYA